jgi:hypothetical protein
MYRLLQARLIANELLKKQKKMSMDIVRAN